MGSRIEKAVRVGIVSLVVFESLSLAACSANSHPSADNSRFPQGVGSEGSPLGNTQQKEQFTPMEKQANAATLNWLLTKLSASQKYTAFGQDVGSITSQITNNKNSFPLNSIANGTTVPKDSDLLTTSWTYTEHAYDNYVKKTLGEAEIKNFRFTGNGILTVSAADKANGIQWKGIATLGYIERHKIRKLNFGNKNSSDSNASESAWTKAIIPPSNVPFSEWKDSGLMLNLILRNGTWEISDIVGYYGVTYPVPVTGYSGTPGVEDVYLQK